MDEALRTSASEMPARLPLSLEMPAGTGKTQLVAAIAAIADSTGQRTLILTHTHAGVDAIRRRLRKFGVTSKNVWIDTITGWAFDLVRSYPIIAGIQVPKVPDWTSSPDYIAGAVRVARAQAIREMHAASFEYFIVDEYQDCNEDQHELVLAISAAIPRACVLGDRLQGIFGFRGQVLVDWDTHVVERFPAHKYEHKAWRWDGHNEPLGQWLLDIRPTLMNGHTLDLSSASIPGLSWNLPNPSLLANTAYQRRPEGESVLILGQWPADTNELARNLNGLYGVMEDLQGNFMLEFLRKVDASDPSNYPLLLADFAKQCFSGLANLNTPILDKLRGGKAVAHLQRADLEDVLVAFDELTAHPSLNQLLIAMLVIANNSTLRLFKREAWYDVCKSIEAAAANPDVLCQEALGRIRDALRHSGRRPLNRVVSRTLLVKGLEYDHVIIADAAGLKSGTNLYVALTRARKTVTIFSRSHNIRF